MTHVSLFAGVGGFDVAAEWAGFETIAQVEIDDYATRVLEKHWPDVHRVRDIRDFPDRDYGTVTLVSGGPPCQPASLAGKRKGTKDDRWLWPDTLRVVESIKPRWVCFENPPGIVELGLADIVSALEGLGYVFPCDTRTGLPIIPCFPIAAVGAPHIRQRAFILAYRVGTRLEGRQSKRQNNGQECATIERDFGKRVFAYRPSESRETGELHIRSGRQNETKSQFDWKNKGIFANGKGKCKRESPNETDTFPESREARIKPCGRTWWETEPPMASLVYGLSNKLAEPAIRLIGNSVSPYHCYPILAAIAECEQGASQ